MKNLKKLQCITFSTFQFAILTIVCFTSSCNACDSNNKKDKNLTGIPSIQLNKSTLASFEEDIKLTIQAAVIEETVNLERFTLKILYEEGTGEISYKDAKGSSQAEQHVEKKITHFLPITELGPNDVKEINFHIKGNPSITHLKVSFALYDDENNQLIDKKSVDWNKQKAGIDLTFVGLADKFVGKESVKFRIKNNGKEKINTNDVEVELKSQEPDIIFRLGKEDGHTIHATLTQILGLASAKSIGSGSETDDLVLKLEDAKAKDASVVIITLKYQGKKFERSIKWQQQPVSLEFFHLPDELHGKDIVEFQIKNKGSLINTDDIQIQLDAPNKMVFKLGNKKEDASKATLTEILGIERNLAQGAHTDNIILELKDPKNQENATIKLTLTCKGIQEEKSIRWKAGKIEVIGLSTFAGKKRATFELKNEGSGSINPSDIEIELTSEPSGLNLEFIVGNKTHIASPAILEKLLVDGNRSINFNEQTSHLQFKVKKPSAIEKATVIVIIRKAADKVELARQPVTWTKKKINLKIENIKPLQLQGTNHTKFELQISNWAQEDAEADKLQLQLRRIKGTQATIVGATKKAADVFVLNDLGNISKNTSNNTYSVTLEPRADKLVEFECQLLYDGYPVGDKKSVSWKGDPRIKITYDNNRLSGDNKKTEILFINESGFELDKEILEKIQIKLTHLTEDAEVKYNNRWGGTEMMDKEATTPLASLLGTHLADGDSRSVEVLVDTGTNPNVEFELEVVESTASENDKKVKVFWEGKPKVKVTAESHVVVGNQMERELIFRNESGFELTQIHLENIIIQLNNLTAGTKVLYDDPGKNIDGAKLADVLGKDGFKWGEVNTIITIDPDVNKEVSFEVELVGSDGAEHDRKTTIEWPQKTE
ncbi:MAG: hypothetical protein BGO68_01135 [Candidatus Amoebophilus sp. 36-38]|nr:MAG: hypothetical protein BGO68_01135 [Candidatus Amoebophilus sp. 36-38]